MRCGDRRWARAVRARKQPGWIEGIQAIDSGKCLAALVVIRTELLANAQQRWPQAEVISLNHPDSPEKIAQASSFVFRNLPAK